MRAVSPTGNHSQMSFGRFLFLSFLIGTAGLAITLFLLADLIVPFHRSAGGIALSAPVGGLIMAGRARRAATLRPSDENAQNWRRHDIVWQATIMGLTLVMIAIGLTLGHVLGQPGF